MKTKQMSSQTMPVILMEPTPHLRWYVRKISTDYRFDTFYREEKTLQQLFMCQNTNKTEWRDVEEVHENH
jgi:hypothetical protein